MRTIAAVTALLLFATASSAAPRRREPPAPPLSPAEQQYRALIADALREYDLARYEEALTLFRQAYALKPTPKVLRGIGKVQFELQRYTRSLEALDAALAGTDEPLTGGLRAEVEALRARSLRYTAVLTVSVTPASAEVTLDGRPLEAEARAAVRVDAGAHTLEATLTGYLPARRTVDAPGGSTPSLALTLAAVAPPAPPRPRRALLYTGIALDAAFALALGGSAGWYADRDRAIDSCAAATRAGASCVNGGAIASQRDAAIALTAVSAVALAGAGALTYLGWRRAHTHEVTLACAPGVGGAACTLGGSF
jgi:tetratricopeptide (TPR) repeat protein